jgi:hypothetical protein
MEDNLKKLYKMKLDQIKEYRINNNLPEFHDTDSYYNWVETEEGKKYYKFLDKLDKEFYEEI